MRRLRAFLGAPRSGARHAAVHRRSLFHVALVVAGFLFASSGVAYAFFSATGTGTYGLAVAGRLTPPATFSGTATSSTQVTLNWTRPTNAPSTYTYVLTGTALPGGTCASTMPKTTTSCTVTTLPSGTSHTWTLGIRFHTWTSTTKQASATTSVASPSFGCVGAIQTWLTPTVTTSTKPVVYPTCAQSTDLLVLILARSHNNDDDTARCPSGWTIRATGRVLRDDSHAFLEVCSTIYTGVGTHVTVTVKGTATRGSSAEIAAFHGVTTTTPFDKTANDNATFISTVTKGRATFTPSNFTTSTAGDLALSVVMENSDVATLPTLTLKTGATQGFAAQTSGGMATAKASGALNFADKAVPSPGPVHFPTWTTTVSTSSDAWIGESLALRADPKTVGSPTGASFVQGAATSSQGAVTTLGVTLATAVSSGDALTLAVDLAPGTATVSAVSGGGVTWHQASGTGNSATVGDAEVWYGLGSAGGPGPVTLTLSSADTVMAADLAEWSGVGALDTATQSSGSGTVVSAGAPGSASDDLIVSAGALSGNITGAVSVSAPFAVVSATGTSSGYAASNPTTGAGAVTWSLAGAASWTAAAAAFSPVAPVSASPTIATVSPSAGSVTGGTSVTITGTNFTATATVTLGATTATSVTVNGPTSITAITPPHASGTVTVTVTTTTGTASAPQAFSYTTSTGITGTTTSGTTTPPTTTPVTTTPPTTTPLVSA